MLKVLASAILITTVCASYSARFPDGSNMTVTAINSTFVEFNVSIADQSYFSVGFGSGMHDVDMIIWQGNGDSSACTDLFSVSESAPPVDASQDVYSTFVREGGNVHFHSIRKLDTGDDKDYVMTYDTSTTMVWAFVSSTYQLIEHNGGDYGEFQMTVNSDPTFVGSLVVIGEEGGVSDENRFWRVHGWMLWQAWGVAGFLQLLTNRYLKSQWKWAPALHLFSGIYIFGVTMVFSLLAFREEGWELEGDLHPILGFISLLTVGLISIGGLLQLVMKRYSKWKTTIILWVALAHKVFGILIIVVSQIAILTGILTYANKVNRDELRLLALVHVIVFVIGGVVLEINYQFRKRKLVDFADPPQAFSLQEFHTWIEKGEKWVILDDLVLNVSKYMTFHPGGRFLIEQNIGRDISKFFYGGYAMENDGKPEIHNHSGIAKTVINSLIIGRLEAKTSQYQGTIKEKADVNSLTTTFNFQLEGKVGGDGKGPQTFYKDISMIGKHFLVNQSLKKTVRRHYTISNIMKKDAYDHLVVLLKGKLDGNSVDVKNDLFDEGKSHNNTLYLTIKNYKQQKGISMHIHGASSSQSSSKEQESQMNLQQDQVQSGVLFDIQGPMGQGLMIKESGTHIAFTGGTGVLVFVDLVAHLARRALGILSEDEKGQIQEDSFKFVLYVSFQSREDSIALDLMEKTRDLCVGQGKEFFELNVRLSKESKERWNRSFIQRELAKYQTGLKRVWVCGPPKMNEEFDKTLGSVGSDFGLNSHSYDIM